MQKLYLFNYRFLPILANSLWKIRNYESINPWNNSIKHFSLNTKEIVLDCYFSRKYVRTNKFEGNDLIKSYLEIKYKSYNIEEKTGYFDSDYDNYFRLKYLLVIENQMKDLSTKDKLELSFETFDSKEISDDLHYSFSPKNKEFLNDIKKIIKNNEDNIKIDLKKY